MSMDTNNNKKAVDIDNNNHEQQTYLMDFQVTNPKHENPNDYDPV